MVKKADLIYIDTNVFVIDLRYRNDELYEENKAFLNHVAQAKNGITGIVNLLEVCGILSFNLNEAQLVELYNYLPFKYHVEIMPQLPLRAPMPFLPIEKIFFFIRRKMRFGDALVISMAEQAVPHPIPFISWDASHFKGKTSLPAMTPSEYITKVRRIR